MPIQCINEIIMPIQCIREICNNYANTMINARIMPIQCFNVCTYQTMYNVINMLTKCINYVNTMHYCNN